MGKFLVGIILLLLCGQAYAGGEPTITINAVKEVFDTRDDVWCNIDKYKLPSYFPSKNPGCEYYRLRNTLADPGVGEDFLTGMIIQVSTGSTALKKIQVKIAGCSVNNITITTGTTLYTISYFDKIDSETGEPTRLDKCFRDGKNSIIVYAEDANWKVTKTIGTINIDSSTPQMGFTGDFGSGSTEANSIGFYTAFTDTSNLWRNYSLTGMISQGEHIGSGIYNECLSFSSQTGSCTGTRSLIEIRTSPVGVGATNGKFKQYNCNSLGWYPSVSECDTTQVCGSAQGQTYASTPTTNLCNLGTPTTVTIGAGKYDWSCSVAGVGSVACQANSSMQNGVCGTASGQNLASEPTTGLCSSGNPTLVSGSGPWTWNCNGIGGGTTASCSANLKINGICNNASKGGCTAGTVSWINNTSTCGTTATWTCSGINGGTASAQCSFANALCPINGVCGGAKGSVFATAPTTNLCSVGNPSGVTTGTTYTWTCSGTNGGTSASCTAYKPAICNGEYQEIRMSGVSPGYGDYDECPYKNPETGACSCNPGCTDTQISNEILTTQIYGIPQRVLDYDGWTFYIEKHKCGDVPLIQGVCGSSHGKTLLNRPVTGLCSSGLFTSVQSHPTTRTWSCIGFSGGSSANCTANIQKVNGTCGTANNKTFAQQPSLNTCSAGRYIRDWETLPRTWLCEGQGGGTTATCKASYAKILTNGTCNNSMDIPCGAGYVSRMNSTQDCGTTATWKCTGLNGGSTSGTCSHVNVACPVNGTCNNTVNGGCTAGTRSWITSTSTCATTATWTCTGLNGGSTSGTCSYTNPACPINGVCNNTVNGGCSAGSLSWVSNVSSCGTTATWKCTGLNGGTTTGTCSHANAACPVNGTCNNMVYGGCSAGNLSWINSTSACGTTATWTCAGTNGGINSAQCSYFNGICTCTPASCPSGYADGGTTTNTSTKKVTRTCEPNGSYTNYVAFLRVAGGICDSWNTTLGANAGYWTMTNTSGSVYGKCVGNTPTCYNGSSLTTIVSGTSNGQSYKYYVCSLSSQTKQTLVGKTTSKNVFGDNSNTCTEPTSSQEGIYCGAFGNGKAPFCYSGYYKIMISRVDASTQISYVQGCVKNQAPEEIVYKTCSY